MIIGTCGHELKVHTTSNNVDIKEYDRFGNKVVSSCVFCDNCIVWFRRNNLILYTEKQKKEWLNSGEN